MNEVNNETSTEATPYPEADQHRRRRKDVFPGLFILLIGVVYLLKQTGVIFPFWFFSWPMLLIAIGVLGGLKHNFQGGGWIIPILIGGLFLLNDVIPELAIGNFIWPSVIIMIGLFLIIRPKNSRQWRNRDRRRWQTGEQWNRFPQENAPASLAHSSDFIDVTTVFGGVKKIILSKNFRGGDVVSFMAGTELNFTQADINGVVTIDATNIFGGTKLIIPPTWDVQSEVVAIFGGVDDKRQVNGTSLQPNKILRLEGTCIFGGIDIRSY